VTVHLTCPECGTRCVVADGDTFAVCGHCHCELNAALDEVLAAEDDVDEEEENRP